MPRGGRRQGRPSGQYPNRSDLAQRVAVAPSQQYGQGAAAERAQQAMPLRQAVQPPGAPQTPPQPGPQPGGRGDFARTTERPGEPVTHGLPIGAGAGPEALGAMAPTPDPILAQVLALYQADPNEDLRQIIEEMQTGA